MFLFAFWGVIEEKKHRHIKPHVFQKPRKPQQFTAFCDKPSKKTGFTTNGWFENPQFLS